MAFGPGGSRMSQVAACVEAAATYLLSEADAREIVDHQIETIEANWDEVGDLAGLTAVDRDYFWQRQFLSPYALQGYRPAAAPA